MSLKTSLAPQAPCIFRTAVWARLTFGMAMAPAAAPATVTPAPLMKRRRLRPSADPVDSLMTASRFSVVPARWLAQTYVSSMANTARGGHVGALAAQGDTSWASGDGRNRIARLECILSELDA